MFRAGVLLVVVGVLLVRCGPETAPPSIGPLPRPVASAPGVSGSGGGGSVVMPAAAAYAVGREDASPRRRRR